VGAGDLPMASSDEINPSRRELAFGVAALTILACLAITRDGVVWHGPLQQSSRWIVDRTQPERLRFNAPDASAAQNHTTSLLPPVLVEAKFTNQP
jgi:hypothetical protein